MSNCSRCSFSMMVKWANDGFFQTNDGKMLVNDGEMIVNDGELKFWSYTHFTIIDKHSPSLTSITPSLHHHSLIWPSLRRCTDWTGSFLFKPPSLVLFFFWVYNCVEKQFHALKRLINRKEWTLKFKINEKEIFPKVFF